jgi:hypothetical protein
MQTRTDVLSEPRIEGVCSPLAMRMLRPVRCVNFLTCYPIRWHYLSECFLSG